MESVNNTNKYTCETCMFSTNYKNVIDKHFLSKKHIAKNNTETVNKYEHACSQCNKTYSTHSGLWKHQKKCIEQAQALSNVQSKHEEEKHEEEKHEEEKHEEEKHEEEKHEEEKHEEGEEKQKDELQEMDEELQTKIKMNIIKIILDHVSREELNQIIEEIYDGK